MFTYFFSSFHLHFFIDMWINVKHRINENRMANYYYYPILKLRIEITCQMFVFHIISFKKKKREGAGTQTGLIPG